MKKQIICMLLAVLFLLSMAGCAESYAAGAGGAAAPGNGSDPASDTTETQDPVGEVRYYKTSMKEDEAYDTPDIARVVELSEKQAQVLQEILDGVGHHWYDDRWFDRMNFYYDGEFQFADSDTVYYFSYERSVIYYFELDETGYWRGYFAEIPERDMEQIKWLGWF